MASWLVSIRGKILLPSAVAVLAMLLATSVTVALLRSASTRLAGVEREDFPVFRISRDLRAAVDRAQLLLAQAAASRQPGTLQAADTLRDDILQRLAWEGITAYGQADKEEIRMRFERYYDEARALAAEGKTAGQESTSAYAELQTLLDAHATRAEATMKAGFREARGKQQLTMLAGAGILVVAALGALVFAWFFSARLSRPIRDLSRVALLVAGGDLRHELKAESRDEVGTLTESFQRMVARLRDIVGTLKATSLDLSSEAERLSDNTRAQSAMLERQAAGVAEVSTSTRELEQTAAVAAGRAASVLEVAKRAAEMSDAGRESAERSAGELRSIQGSVEDIVTRSTELLQQARQVGAIVATVRDLAAQSHVLSLNASIEAARAGTAGRGFAVVAHEMRALADQSGQGASRIAKMVSDVLVAVGSTRATTEQGSQAMADSVGQIRGSGERLREIGGIVRETSDAALQIASALQQQSAGIGQIALAMRDLDKGMEETVGRIRALEHSASSVAESAMRMSGIADQFQV